MQRSILPYISPDWNGILADKESAQGFEYPAGGENISPKISTTDGSVCQAKQVYKYVKKKQIKTNSNKVTPSYPKKKNNVREKTNQDSKQPVKETRSCNTTRKQEEK